MALVFSLCAGAESRKLPLSPPGRSRPLLRRDLGISTRIFLPMMATSTSTKDMPLFILFAIIAIGNVACVSQ